MQAACWVDEKLAHLNADIVDGSGGGGGDDWRFVAELPIGEQLVRLQKQQTFEAELRVHEERMRAIDQRCGCGAASNDRQVQQCRERLQTRWAALHAAVARRNKAFEAARDLLSFEQLVDTVWTWIKDKVNKVIIFGGE